MNLFPWCGRLAPAVLLLAALAAPAAIHREPPIEAKEFPEAVLIESHGDHDRKLVHGCGVLVGPRTVLTVAHLVEGFDSWTVTAPYVTSGLRRQTVRTAHVYPGYKPDDLERDLAVVRLTEALSTGRKAPRLNDGELLPLETKLICLGRVVNGHLSADRLYEAPTTLASFPGDLNLYGGVPARTEPGDSGGPIYRINRGKYELVALALGHLSASRANVATDALLPLSRTNAGWIHAQSAP